MFFESSLVIQKPVLSTIPKCGACGLYKTCKSPKMPVSGQGRKGILVIAEAPGADEDDQNTQLVGKAGQFLRRALDRFDIDLDRDCWKTNALICRPPDNATPTDDQVDWCRPNVQGAIDTLNPRVIMPMGAAAVRSLLGPLWRDNVGSIGDWVGWRIPLQRWNCWITPTWHPSYVMRMLEDSKVKESAVLRIWFERHLRGMSELQGRPYDEVPDYASKVRIVTDHREAAKWIRESIQIGGLQCPDFETDRLKPDHPDARIVSCAIARKDDTIAFPWVGDVIPAMREWVVSPLPKVGANTKFESRWSQAILGEFVNNFVWDTMLSAHHLDNRGGTNSVKMQAFVRMGQEPWNVSVEPFLQSDPNVRNRIHEVDLRTLLKYNGMDALIELLLARIQREEMLACPILAS